MAAITAPIIKAICFILIDAQRAQLTLAAEWLRLFGSIRQAKSHNIQ